MEDIERARVQEVIHEGADRGMPFRQLGGMRAELFLKEVKFMTRTGVCCDEEFGVVRFGAEDGWLS